MVKTTVYLEPGIALDLKQIATAEGRSQAELIREALSDFARKRKRPVIPGLGEFDSGRTDTSERAEDILRKASTAGKWRRSRGAGR
jgi:predicted transcriptional regulator